MRKDQVLKNAEALVRDILIKDSHQKLSHAAVREVALKVAKVIPTTSAPKSRQAG